MSSAADARPLTVALLGGGTVGASVARLLVESARDLEERVGAPIVLTAVAVRDADKPRPGVPADLVTSDAAGVAASGADIVVELIGGIEPARTLILVGHGRGLQRRHRQQGPAGGRRGHPLRGGRAQRGRPLLRGRRRRCDPAAAAAEGVPRRRQGHQGPGHRQRHHELHAHQDGRGGRRLRDRSRGGPGARLRRGGSDRRRRGARRGRQGRDPRRARLPHAGHARRRVLRGDLEGHGGGHHGRPSRWASSSSCSRSRSSPTPG